MPKLQEMAYPDSNFQNFFSMTKSFELALPLVVVEVKFEPHQ
jgi:hypothetical protein